MHILVTNDDGPPSTHTSPYVLTLVRELQRAGHKVSVCLPNAQRSWIGKAHLIGQSVRPLYYRPPPIHVLTEDSDQGTTHLQPYRAEQQLAAKHEHKHDPSSKDGSESKCNGNDKDVEEWVLVEGGTPASCVQLGLYHLFGGRQVDNDAAALWSPSGSNASDVDLVVSGPNYGRNTTAVFSLSSGTLGGALEAAVCRTRAIAVSFAFFTRNHDVAVIEAACRHTVRVITALHREWPTDGSVDLYSVNVPMREDVETRRSVFVPILQNYWHKGGCFVEVKPPPPLPEGDAEEQEEKLREGKEGEAEMGRTTEQGQEAAAEEQRIGDGDMDDKSGRKGGAAARRRHFQWAPTFGAVHESVQTAGPGNDGWTVKEGETSITPLKANFHMANTHLHHQELKL